MMAAFRSLIFNDEPRKTRVEYREWRTEDILRQIGIEEEARQNAETEDEKSAAELALQELRAVLLERARAH